jgi:hypothetical protein
MTTLGSFAHRRILTHRLIQSAGRATRPSRLQTARANSFTLRKATRATRTVSSGELRLIPLRRPENCAILLSVG